MKCYQHRETEAVGVCKTCGKAVCPDCTVDQGFALTCQGECETIARANHQLNTNAIAMYSSQKKNRYVGALFFLLLGSLFIIFGLGESFSFNFLVASGAALFCFGVALFVAQRKLMTEIKT